MELGIGNLKDLTEIAAYIVTIISLIGLWIAVLLSKKQIYFTAMEKCIRDFRDFNNTCSENSELKAQQYFELINEEFFYFENKYLPYEVAIEWIDGMIDFLPFFQNNGTFHQSKEIKSLKSAESTIMLLVKYPRVRKVIQLSVPIDFSKIYNIENEELQIKDRKIERDKLIFCMISNLNVGFFRKRRFRRKIARR